MIYQRITAEVRLDFIRLADGTIKIDTSDIVADFDRNKITPLRPHQLQAFKTPLNEQWEQLLTHDLLPILEGRRRNQDGEYLR